MIDPFAHYTVKERCDYLEMPSQTRLQAKTATALKSRMEKLLHAH